jgi:glycosyltransferase involved in cell wall biosynthesis
MPKFSVITVSKNPGLDFKKTLESVKNQYYRDFEYLVIDGNSDDTTPKLFNEYKTIIDLLIIESDNGIYDAMNKGIKNSCGEFIIFLNAGDMFTTEYTLSALDKVVQNENKEIYYGKIIWVDVLNSYVINSKHDHIKHKSQLESDNFPHPATIYARSSFEKYGYFNLDYPIYADYEWNLRALLKYNASYLIINTIVTTFYTGGVSTNEINNENKKEEIKKLKNSYFKKINLSKYNILCIFRL